MLTAAPMLHPGFITAGRAIYTIVNPAGVRYTFRVQRGKARPDEKPIFYVSYLTGPNNQEDYTYLGVLSLRSNPVRVVATYASRLAEDHPVMRIASFSARVLLGQQALPEGYSIHHMGQCARCRRPLTTPESIESGIGPECRKKVGRLA